MGPHEPESELRRPQTVVDLVVDTAQDPATGIVPQIINW
jgi:hypothetical protein